VIERAERARALRQVPAFAALGDEELRGLLACLRWRELAAGEALYRQGEPGDRLAILAAGALVATVALARGGDCELGRVAPGGIVGEMVCLDPAPRSATVVATEPSVVAELGRDGLTGLRLGAPRAYAAVMRAVLEIVGRRLRELDDRIDLELGGAPTEARAPAPPAPAAAPAGDAAPPRPHRDGFRGLLDRILGGS